MTHDSNAINAQGCCDETDSCPECNDPMEYRAHARRAHYYCKFCGFTTETIEDCIENINELAEDI